MPPRPGNTLTIDLGAIRHNMGVLKQLVGAGKKICCVVKANAYGLGIDRVLPALLPEADMFAVFSIPQAVELLSLNSTREVLVLSPDIEYLAEPETIHWLKLGKIILSIHGPEHLSNVAARLGSAAWRTKCHIDIDSGMSRGGTDLADVVNVAQMIRDSHFLMLAGTYSHFSCAETSETICDQQHALFERSSAQLLQTSPGLVRHLANTSGAFRSKKYHFDMIRVGLAWTGFCESYDRRLHLQDQLRGCISWRARIVHHKQVETGQSVGYGARWTSPRPALLCLVSCGYADGIPGTSFDCDGSFEIAILNAEARPVGIAPVVGRTSMDQIVVDVSQINSRVVDMIYAELLSSDINHPAQLLRFAKTLKTCPQDILCGIGKCAESIVSK